ncbi:MAG: DNA polymerase III subunit gamma/tau [Betaproteobacteria bacterium]|nr:DNA polymerase III subunit gamma/tau [Betaproteobacteria bacterium]
MSYQVLARRWRPRNFSTLVGQEHVVRALTHALDEQRLHHAYLFTGTRGVGKTTLARIIAKALNCEAGVSSEPCGRCLSCEEIDAGRFVDLIEVDAATNTKAEEMRQLLENAVYAPTRGRYKVYVIDEVHMLSGHAFNAMLKTLEEPPEHVKFVLATTDPQKIPVTVLSRCLQFSLKQMPVAAIVEHLGRILQSEDIPFEGEALATIARAASGSMRDALSLLDQSIAHGAGKVEAAGVRDMLGAVDATRLLEMLEALAAGDVSRMLAIANEMLARSLSAAGALQELAMLLTRIQLLQLAADAESGESAERERLEALARRFTPEFIQLAYQIAVQGRAELPLAPDEESGLVMTILRLHAFAPSGENFQINVAREPAPASPPAPTLSPAAPATAPGKKPDDAPDKVYPASLPETVFAPSGREEKAEDDNEWHVIFAALKLTGATRQLAQNCDLIQRENDLCLLRLPPAHQALLQPDLQEKLQQALSQHFGIPMRLSIEVASPERTTPAERRMREQERRQEEAVAAIEADPFVREAIESLDARVDQKSIQPLL